MGAIFGLFSFAAFFIVTFVALPLAVYGAAAALTRPSPKQRMGLFALVAPVAPLALSFVVMAAYSLPFAVSSPIVVTSILIPLGLALWTWRHSIRAVVDEIVTGVRGFGPQRSIAEVVLYVLAAIVFVQLVAMPLMENDPIEYHAVAKYIFETGSLSVYPVIEAAPNGLFAPPSHPPAYHMYIVWGYAWLGTETFVPARLMSIYALVATAWLLGSVLSEHGRRGVVLGLLLLLATPLYVSSLVAYHIDPIRLGSFLAAAVAVARLIERPERETAILAGSILGLAAFAHSIGLLAVVFGGLAWLLLGPSNRFYRFGLPILVGLFALLFGGAQYLKNLYMFGVPLHDSVPVWDMPEIDFESDLQYRRDLVRLRDKLLFGVFRGFVELPLFGLLFWFALLGAWRVSRRWAEQSTVTRVAFTFVAAFFALALLTALFGSTLVIKNPRYVMTIVPLLIVLAVPILAKWPQARSLWMKGATLILFALLASWTIVQSGVRLARYGTLQVYTAGERAPIYRGGKFPGGPLFVHVEKELKPGEKTLVFRQADFTLYGTGGWIDNFDTQLMPFYRLKTAQEAYDWLRARKVRFVLLPYYTYPMVYRTAVEPLLADTSLVEYVGDHHGYRLFRLNDERAKVACDRVPREVIPLTLWQRKSSLLGLISSVSGVSLLDRQNDINLGEIHYRGDGAGRRGNSETEVNWRYGQRFRLVSGEGGPQYRPDEPWLQTDGEKTLITVTLDIGGKGFAAVDVIEYPEAGPIVSKRMWDGLVDQRMGAVEFQFVPGAQTRSFRVAIENVGRASGMLKWSPLEICRTGMVVDRKRGHQERAVQSMFQAKDLSRGEIGYVRQVVGDHIRIWGDYSVLYSPDFEWNWAFYFKAQLERIRLMIEYAGESTVARVLTPFYELISGEELDAAKENYQLVFDAAGLGGITAFVQYTTADGRTTWRRAGSTFLVPERRTATIRFGLPAGATDYRLAYIPDIRDGGHLEIGPSRIEKLLD